MTRGRYSTQEYLDKWIDHLKDIGFKAGDEKRLKKLAKKAVDQYHSPKKRGHGGREAKTLRKILDWKELKPEELEAAEAAMAGYRIKRAALKTKTALVTIGSSIKEIATDRSKIKKSLQKKYKKLKEKGLTLTIKEVFERLGIVSWTDVLFAVFRGLLGVGTLVEMLFGQGWRWMTTSCLVGGFPLGCHGAKSGTSVQEIDIAHSNKVVKFRATGSVFLAHQVGNKDSVKITGTLDMKYGWAESAFYFLWILTLMSQGRVKGFENSDDMVEHVENTTSLRGKIAEVGYIDTFAGQFAQNPAIKQYFTFPVVTRHAIIPNCYIETFSFEETLEGGKDIIKYDLMLRTYQGVRKIYKHGKQYGVEKSKLMDSVRFGANWAWRTLQQTYDYFNVDEKSWKVENYYNVDAVDVGISAGISLISFMGEVGFSTIYNGVQNALSIPDLTGVIP